MEGAVENWEKETQWLICFGPNWKIRLVFSLSRGPQLLLSPGGCLSNPRDSLAAAPAAASNRHFKYAT